MEYLKIKILSELLYHANRYYFGVWGKETFYEIKNELLKKYGRVVGQDLQFIEGKKCYSCDGTGIYRRYYVIRDGKKYRNYEGCWHCVNGMYKRPFWSLLNRVQIGNYVFHQPVRRIYDATELLPIKEIPTVFHGYVNHRYTPWSETCAFILTFIYRRKEMRKMSCGYNRGWRLSRLLHKFCHVYYFGKDSIPYTNFQGKKYKFIGKSKTKLHGIFQTIVEKIYSIQDDLVEPSKEEKETELLAKIYGELPDYYAVWRNRFNEWTLAEIVGHPQMLKVVTIGDLEEIYEFIEKELKEEFIPF